MSESGELVRELLGLGMSRRGIGQAIGRNDRLIGYVEKDVKPGENLRDSLRELRDRLTGGVSKAEAVRDVPEPSRRTVRGRPTNVRKPATRKGTSWQTSTIKRQAVRSGGKGLMHSIGDAADDGRELAVTVSFDKGMNVLSGGSGKRGRPGRGGSVELKLGDAEDVFDRIESQYDGEPAAFLAAVLMQHGYVSAETPGDVVGHMTAVEVRGW